MCFVSEKVLNKSRQACLVYKLLNRPKCSWSQKEARSVSLRLFFAPILEMEAVSSFELSVNFYETRRRQIPENNILGSKILRGCRPSF